MDEAAIIQYITDTFDGSFTAAEWGDTFFYYNPGSKLPNDIYFATLKTGDDDYDRASNLDRPGVFRLNIGVSKDTYRRLFGAGPTHIGSGQNELEGHDLTALDRIMPHPVYASMGWVCVVNPGPETFDAVKLLLAEAYDRALAKFAKRARTMGDA
jgi:hypothetical protein